MSFWHNHVKNPDSMLRIYALTWLVTIVLFSAVFIGSGGAAVLTVAILAGLEVTFSFDNAVVNAKVLQRMDPVWQKIFMTAGIAIAVFGMRMVLPIVLVSITAKLGMGDVVQLALHHPLQYAEHLHKAHASIAAFGGTFLLMIFLDFVTEERDIQWLRPIERRMVRVGNVERSTVIIAGIIILTTAKFFAGSEWPQVVVAGMLGLVAYLIVNGLDSYFEAAYDSDESNDLKPIANRSHMLKAGLFSFIYLEMLDASFSFDGVIGAFAITDKVLLIAAGLGIGAVHVRSLTVHVLRHGTLAKYRYLEHGAHWAIGTLALLLLATIKWEIPEYITGGIGITFIGLAFLSSRGYNRRNALVGVAGQPEVAPTSVRVPA